MGKKIDSSSHKLVEIDDKSHQPKLPVFPKRKCGIKDRCFQHDWFEKWSWLYYNELNDAAYCFTRTKAIKEKKVKTGNINACFVSSRFTNWKDAMCAFERYEVSDAHKATIEVIVTISKTTKDTRTAFSEECKRKVTTNCQMLLQIIIYHPISLQTRTHSCFFFAYLHVTVSSHASLKHVIYPVILSFCSKNICNFRWCFTMSLPVELHCM